MQVRLSLRSGSLSKVTQLLSIASGVRAEFYLFPECYGFTRGFRNKEEVVSKSEHNGRLLRAQHGPGLVNTYRHFLFTFYR